MNNRWRERDGELDLHKIMVHFNHRVIEENENHVVYGFASERFVVINTSSGDRYYAVSKPEVKLTVFDFVLDRMSKQEGTTRENIWQKIDAFYTDCKELGFEKDTTQELAQSDNMFNHFRGYKEQYGLIDTDEKEVAFHQKVYTDNQGDLIFPLYNLTNTLTGYIRENENGTEPIGDSDSSASIWFSNIPEKFEKMFVFTSAGEALAFHKRFGLANAVYVALDKINYDTAKILVQIYKHSKVSKIGLSFTGKSKMIGYINDLMLLSFINDANFLVRVEPNALLVQFNPEGDHQLSKTFREIKKYNQAVTQGYLEYNSMLDQVTVNKKLIVMGRKKDMVVCKLPLDISAIRYFLWSYYRNYMGKMIKVLKPGSSNWKQEFEAYGVYQGKEIEEEHKIAV